MYSLNRSTILGNLTKDPEIRKTTSGQQVCTFGVATNRTWNDAAGAKQEAVEFHHVVAWGKLAEICAQYLTKGKKVYIEGRLQTREWDGQDGIKRFRTEIVTENMIMLDRSGAPTGAPTAPRSSFGGNSFTPPKPPVQADRPINPDDEIYVEDIPF